MGAQKLPQQGWPVGQPTQMPPWQVRHWLAWYHALAELLGKPANDALGAADVAEPIRVLVLHHFADQFGAVGAQARDDVVDVIDGEHDAAGTERELFCDETVRAMLVVAAEGAVGGVEPPSVRGGDSRLGDSCAPSTTLESAKVHEGMF